MINEWKDRSPDTIALQIRPNRTISVGANEVFVLRKDGQIVDVVSEGRSQIQTVASAVAGSIGFGPRFDGYIAHTDPVKLSYWSEDPAADMSFGPESFGPPLITKDALPIIAQVTLEVSVDPENADRLLRVIGNRHELTTQDLQDRFRDEIRAKLGVELEKHSSTHLRGNPDLLRALYEQTHRELESSLVNFGLKLVNFYIAWGLTLVQKQEIQVLLNDYQDGRSDLRSAKSETGGRSQAKPAVQVRSRGSASASRRSPMAWRRSPLVRFFGLKPLITIGIAAVLISWRVGLFDPVINYGQPAVVVTHWANTHLMRAGLLPDMAERFNKAGHRTKSGSKIQVSVSATSSGKGARDLVSRVNHGVSLQPDLADPVIFTPHVDHWLVSVNHQAGRTVVDLAAAQSIARSYIGIVTYKDMAECLGWPDKKIGYSDIIALRADPEGWASYPCAKAEWGKRPLVAFTDPTTSSTGRSVLFSLYSIAAGKAPEELTVEDISDEAVIAYVKQFQGLIDHYMSTSIVLNTKVYQGPRYGHFFLMAEDNLIHLYEGTVSAFINGEKVTAPPIDRPVVMIYPKEGATASTHCACMVQGDWVTAEQSEAAAIWVAFLREDSQQRALMQAGFRPGTDLPLTDASSKINGEFGLNPDTPAAVLNPSLIAPETAAAIDGSWADVKRPSIVTFVVDTSGSMHDDKLQQAKDGLIGAMDAMDQNNRVGFISFDNTINNIVPAAPLAANRFTIAETIQKVKAKGQTALYDAIKKGIEMTDAAVGDSGAIRGVIVLTDGQGNVGETGLDDLIQMMSRNEIDIQSYDGFVDSQPVEMGGRAVSNQQVTGIRLAIETVHPVQVFFIGIGDSADIEVGRMLAEATGAEFQGVTEEDLANVLAQFGKYF